MTGDNLADRDDFQTALWPSEWNFEMQRQFGAIDATDLMPAGASFRYALLGGDSMAVQLPVSRGFL